MKSHVYNDQYIAEFIASDGLEPHRATKGSAGYDFIAPKKIVVPAHSTVQFGSGVKVNMRNGYVLMLYIRSSLGLKHGLSLPNSVAVIDSDYHEEIQAAIRNSSDYPYMIEKGERYMQGVFTKYYLAEEDEPTGTRNGGVGSTGK